MSDVNALQPKRGRLATVVIFLTVLASAVSFYAYMQLTKRQAQTIASLDTIYWKRVVPSVDLVREGNEISVTTTSGKTDYQIEASPELPAGTIVVHYRVQLLDGNVMIGVLSADRQQWLATDPIDTPGINEREIQVHVPDEGTVLFANNRETNGTSHFIINKLDFTKQP